MKEDSEPRRKFEPEAKQQAKLLKRFIEMGFPKPIARKAAYNGAIPVKTLPELTNPAGDAWLEKNSRTTT